LFFVLLVFAALTPTIAGFEPLIAWLQERRGVARVPAVGIAVSAAWLLGIGGVLSFSGWSGWHPLGWLPSFENRTFFDVLDFVTPNVLLPVGALATSVFAGRRISRTILDGELSETTSFARRGCVWALRYVCPIAIAAVLAAALW
jgi:NSS family neurotransmitter:Na+ symporter